MDERLPSSDKSPIQWLTIRPDQAGQRVDNFLRVQLKGVPKGMIYRILRKGEVRVNKGRVGPDYKLREGDVVRVPPMRLSESVTPQVGAGLAQTLRGAVVHEDDELLVLDKPAGLSVHAGSGVRVGVIEALRQLFPELPGIELAHRLDRDTSGLLVVAKTRSALLTLHDLFRDDQIEKTYLAIVHGVWPQGRTVVDAPLEKNLLRGGERMVTVSGDGKPSSTAFSVVQVLRGTTLVQAVPRTGRTHQIRVHAAHVGHAIVGDEKYGDASKDRSVGAFRLGLHAARLRIPRPGRRALCLEAKLPSELAEFVRAHGA